MRRGGGAGVRLSGGRWRGRRVRAASGVRPTEGRVREALASIWQTRLEGARVLDLFAGSGAVAFELMSRGAGSALLVDKSPRAVAALKESVRQLGAEDAVRIRRCELPQGASSLGAGRCFDLLMADPPYAFEAYGALLSAVAPLAAAGAELAIEHAAARDLAAEIEAAAGPPVGGEAWRPIDRRRYGDCALSLFSRID
ncbi:MAG: RsmD family RNA methyltransferase [Acidobacteriota bacterium]